MKTKMLVLSLAAVLCAGGAGAQVHEHTARMHSAEAPAQAGQSAFAAVAEVVAILEADTTTDWSRVDLEALRQHLIDMDEVTLNAAVVSRPVAGGARFDVTGEGRTAASIRRIAGAHAAQTGGNGYRTQVEEIPGGVRMTVTGDSVVEAEIRGLGFIGLLTLGSHHPRHHLAIARGEASHAHGH